MALRTADDRTTAALAAAGVLLLASAATLAGCVQQRGPAPAGGAARLAPDEGFFLSANDQEGLKLVYGRADTDDVWLMLECRPGARQVDIYDVRAPNARRGDRLTLTADRARSTLPTELEPDEENGGKLVVAHAAAGVAALAGFRRTGDISIKLGSQAYRLTATPTERTAIARFFDGCERT